MNEPPPAPHRRHYHYGTSAFNELFTPESAKAHVVAMEYLHSLLGVTITPAQWFDKMRNADISPEARLLHGVFDLAMYDLFRGPGPKQRSPRRTNYWGAVEYFQDVESTGLCSFKTLMDLYAIDPARASKRIFEQLEAGVKPMQYRHDCGKRDRKPVSLEHVKEMRRRKVVRDRKRRLRIKEVKGMSA